MITGARVGIMAADEDREALAAWSPIRGRRHAPHHLRLGSEADLATVASRLYAVVRELDSSGVDRILARAFRAKTVWQPPIPDRLRRAAV